MSKVLLFLLIAVVVWGVYRISRIYNQVDEHGNPRPTSAAVAPAEAQPDLPQLAPAFENSLAQAKAAGVGAMQDWIGQYGARIQEPRKSAIELDYAQMLVLGNPAEARRIFLAVKARNGPNSPLAPRIKTLTRTFE